MPFCWRTSPLVRCSSGKQKMSKQHSPPMHFLRSTSAHSKAPLPPSLSSPHAQKEPYFHSMQCPLSAADVVLPCATMAWIQPLALAKPSQEATHSTPCGLEATEGLHPSSEHGELPTHLNPRTQPGRTLRTSRGASEEQRR